MSTPESKTSTFAKFQPTGIPHADAMGMTLVEIGEGTAVAKVVYAPHLVGNPETGVVHGGVITSLLDNTAGVAVQTRAWASNPIATLDLRIDYMKPATAGEDIFAFAECYRVTSSIAFVRGVAYHTDRADPIAAVTATFMLGTRATRNP